MVACTRVQRWYLYIAVSLITFFGGVLILLPCRLLWNVWCKSDDEEATQKRRQSQKRFSRIRAGAEGLLAGQTPGSKAFVMIFWICDLAGIVLYFVDAARYTIDDCGEVIGDISQYVWLALCAVYAIHYAIRFIAASDKLFMWIELYSVVDHFTIGPSFVGLYLNQNWLGMRFLRILGLLNIPEKLQIISVVKSRQMIRLSQVAVIFGAVWLGSAGFVHILENNGDPFHNYENGQYLPYWKAVYWMLVTMSTVGFGEISPTTDLSRAFVVIFIIGSFCENAGDPHHNFTNGQSMPYGVSIYWMLITMSTVGYGDYSPKTDIGSIFIIFFIMGSFAMFTSIVPELVRSLGKSSKYKKPYKRTYGRSHIVVCGHLTYGTVSNFTKNFIHEDFDGSGKTDIVFIDTQKPTLELEAFFRRHFSEATFIQGTVMDLASLENIKLRDAEACIILADRAAPNPDEEDAINIMRAIAVKNFCPEIRCVIMLLQYHNKSHLLHIPSWSWDKLNGDEVICVAEFKLGLLAQNCLAPGISTLLSNLFTMRSLEDSGETDWLSNYQRGAGNELYVMPLSDEFAGQTFPQVAEICFSKLDVLLLAVGSGDTSKTNLKLNPGDDLIIKMGTIGYFIAQDITAVRKASVYRFPNPRNGIKPYMDDSPISRETRMSLLETSNVGHLEFMEEIGYKLAHYGFPMFCHGTLGSRMVLEQGDGDAWIVLTENSDGEIAPSPGEGIDAEDESMDISGMFHWCPSTDMKDITLNYESARDKTFENHVIVCLQRSSTDAQIGLVNFVKPLRASTFRAADLQDIVLIGEPEFVDNEWKSVANFPNIFVFKQSASRRMDLRAVNAGQCAMCVVLAAGKAIKVDHTSVDMDAILTTLNIRSMFGDNLEERIRSIGVLDNPEVFRRQMALSAEIPLITELEHDSDVAFVDQDDEDDPNTPLYLTTPYATGSTFSTSVLDSLMSCTFLNGEILTLVRALITGGEAAEFERILAEGLGVIRKTDLSKTRHRNRLAQLPLSHGPLEKLPHEHQYGELFVQALRVYRVLCLGVFRLVDHTTKDPRQKKRYVITSPPYHFKIYASDKIFVLRPFDMEVRDEEFTPAESAKPNQARRRGSPSSADDVAVPITDGNLKPDETTTF